MQDDNDNDRIGTVVTSRAGRDKGRSFLVVGEPEPNYVLVVDGTLRKLVKPKRKKLKHLIVHDTVADGIRLKLLEGKQVFDAEIRRCLLNMGYNLQEPGDVEVVRES